MAKSRLDLLGAWAAVIGPGLLFVYFWSEAVYGPSQPNGGPLRMALGFTLITGGFICFGLALLRLHAQAPNGASRIGRAGTVLGASSLVLLAIGAVLWWPVLFVWPDLGPLAGAPVGLGMLCLFGAWVFLGQRAAQEQSLPSWVRALPLALFVLLVSLLVVLSTASPWPLAAPIFAAFAAGWILVAYRIWRPGALTTLRLTRDALM